MKKIAKIDIEDFSKDISNSFIIRKTTRAVIFNEKNQIAVIRANKYGYYVLPGGGVEENETKEESLKRECLEEAGVNIEIKQSIGTIEEIQRVNSIIQYSYCYIAKKVGNMVEQKLEENEKEADYQLHWYSIEDALEIFKNDSYFNILGKYSYLRNLAIIKETINILKSSSVNWKILN